MCFQAWKQSKHQLLIDAIKKRKAEESAQKKKLEEEQERKLNSQKVGLFSALLMVKSIICMLGSWV